MGLILHPILKILSSPFSCQIGVNTESAMEKESWIKQMQNPNPALFQGNWVILLDFSKNWNKL